MLRWILTAMITSLLFFPDKGYYEKPEDYGFDYETPIIKTRDGVRIHGWYLKGQGREKGALLHLHGNAGNISGRLSKVQGWVERGFSVLLLDYRGYGQSEGSIQHEKDLLEDAEAGFAWLVQEKKWAPKKIVVYGESLGSYPAVRMGTAHDPAALILEAPYTSFTELAPVHYGMIPEFMAGVLLKNFAFANRDFVGKLRIPVFILHGTNDPTCPYVMGQTLFQLAAEPKEFFSVAGGEHNNLPETAGNDFWEKPYQFVMKYL